LEEIRVKSQSQENRLELLQCQLILIHHFLEVSKVFVHANNILDLFQQGIEESGTVYLCYEGALGSTDRNYLFASQMCGISSTDWNSGNFGSLKSCLMNLNISQGIVGESVSY
jgi:hypothetical protein